MHPRTPLSTCFLILPVILLALVAAIAFSSAPFSRAEESATSTIQTQIDNTGSKIEQLRSEIAKLQGDLDTTSKQKQTLQTAVKSLDLNIQKLTKSITLTNAQISQKDLEIKKLSGNITTTSGRISLIQSQVAASLRQLDVIDTEPIAITVAFSSKTISSFFDEIENLSTLSAELEKKVTQLLSFRTNLQSAKISTESKRKELAALKQNLNQQKQGLVIARETQNQLLKDTKNKESNYQDLIAQKKIQEEQFEQDLLNFEAQLKLTVNQRLLPISGSGVLAWPVDGPVVTQYFGNTPFATKNPSIYNGRGHTGIDLRASPGTPIRAARGGIVMGIGNTDLTCPRASYGKWIFIEHDNGLSTIYAHLSVMLVSQGQQVTTGQVIAYSGTTGYATGPHLHFGVYATEGSKVASWASRSSACKGKLYTTPVASLGAYLNPLSYLLPSGQ